MKGIKERLEQDLLAAVGRLRLMDGAVALEEAPGPIGSADGDEFDEAQEIVRREIGFATRELLVERVHRLQTALDRLRDGDYGTCIECGEAIAAARLRALPEVQTCVRCQDRIERLGRRLEEVEAEVGSVEDDD
ncbi:MAG TPA: TraR/DksA C4-type zinc finger protein [Methylomirabilota bacterium]|jgi:DnaK suppressor protein|nr:TraR/DksA C4-type zinc finger protein [Methylomirabilota bacterium]